MKVNHIWSYCRIAGIVCFKFSPKRYSKLSFSRFRRPESRLVTMKFDSPQYRALFTPEVNMLSELFHKYGYGLRMAGGAVRDLLMNKQPDDVDFATTATPDQMKEMFTAESVRMFNRKGESHGTVTVRINDKQNFEITTLRVDMHTDGRHAEVEFTTDWELDAGRRDLTINAMFLGLDGVLYDYFNGREDLEKKCVRFVGDPDLRIREDYLRILRYFRFYGRIAVEPDKHDSDTLVAVRNNAEGLAKISGERIWMELKKILAGNYAKEITLRMMDLGLSNYIGLPDNPNLEEFKEVCDTLQSMNPHYMTRLTAFFRIEDDISTMHNRVKFSKYERELALFIFNNKHENSQSLKPYTTLILSSKFKQTDVYEWACEVLKYKGEISLCKELSEWKIPKFPVNGFMLMEMGYKQGPRMTQILTLLKSKWIESDFKMSKEELLSTLNAGGIGDK